MSMCMCMYEHLVFVMAVCTLNGAVCEYMYVYVCRVFVMVMRCMHTWYVYVLCASCVCDEVRRAVFMCVCVYVCMYI